MIVFNCQYYKKQQLFSEVVCFLLLVSLYIHSIPLNANPPTYFLAENSHIREAINITIGIIEIEDHFTISQQALHVESSDSRIESEIIEHWKHSRLIGKNENVSYSRFELTIDGSLNTVAQKSKHDITYPLNIYLLSDENTVLIPPEKVVEWQEEAEETERQNEGNLKTDMDMLMEELTLGGVDPCMKESLQDRLIESGYHQEILLATIYLKLGQLDELSLHPQTWTEFNVPRSGRRTPLYCLIDTPYGADAFYAIDPDSYFTFEDKLIVGSDLYIFFRMVRRLPREHLLVTSTINKKQQYELFVKPAIPESGVCIEFDTEGNVVKGERLSLLAEAHLDEEEQAFNAMLNPPKTARKKHHHRSRPPEQKKNRGSKPKSSGKPKKPETTRKPFKPRKPKQPKQRKGTQPSFGIN